MIIDNNLEVGVTYNNLKEMCNILGLKYSKSANSRNASLKQIECNYKLERKGNKYTVLEKYNIPKEKEDKRKNNGGHIGNTKYELLMDNLLTNWFYNISEEGDDVDITFNQLFGIDKDKVNIPLLTKDYKDLLDIGYEQFAQEVSIRKDLVDMYAEKLRKIISKCLETALNRLQKQEVITWNPNIMVKYYDLEMEIADGKLIEVIKEKEKEVYEEIGITPFQRRNSIINKNFKKAVYNKLTEYKVSSYWKVYSIEIINFDKIIKIENVDEIKKELTARFIKSIRQSLLNKKYNNKIDNTNGIGKITTYEYNPFDSTESLVDMNKLDGIFFVDYQEKDYIDILNELWDDANNNEEEIHI